jgi:hypothetical protein
MLLSPLGLGWISAASNRLSPRNAVARFSSRLFAFMHLREGLVTTMVSPHPVLKSRMNPTHRV